MNNLFENSLKTVEIFHHKFPIYRFYFIQVRILYNSLRFISTDLSIRILIAHHFAIYQFGKNDSAAIQHNK